MLGGCMDFGPSAMESFDAAGRGVVICNEGNFMYGNASMSYYTPADGRVENEVFIRANDMRLGDVAHSMTFADSVLYVVVNNSGVVYAINPATFTLQGMLTGVNSPRYIHLIAPDKGYITDLYDSRINIFDPRTMRLTGHIPTPSHPSTECMVGHDDKVFVACWSGDNTILTIDTATDTICDSIRLGGQPKEMVLDAVGKLWIATDCGKSGTATPLLYRLSTEPLTVELCLPLPNIAPVAITTDASRRTIYLLNGDVWAMPYTSSELPTSALIRAEGRLFYALGIDPATDDIYCSDAIDYVQPGIVYVYDQSGGLKDKFTAGIIPGSFCFK